MYFHPGRHPSEIGDVETAISSSHARPASIDAGSECGQ